MHVADMMGSDGRVFLKSVFGQIDEDWLAVSFSRQASADSLKDQYAFGRDIVINVGTSHASFTQDADHRSRLLAALAIDPSVVVPTQAVISAANWAKYGRQWPYSLRVTEAARMDEYHEARKVCPLAYSKFSRFPGRGSTVEVTGDEREAIMSLEVSSFWLHRLLLLPSISGNAASAPGAAQFIAEQARRIANSILLRVARSGEESVRVNPLRSAPEAKALSDLIIHRWQVQQGRCALCNGRLPEAPANKMLQASADRINSSNGAYSAENIQVTHLACNLAKNNCTDVEFGEWLGMIIQAST